MTTNQQDQGVSGRCLTARAPTPTGRSRLRVSGIACIAIAAGFVGGVNSGYDLGADTMQCLAFSLLAKQSPDVVHDACDAAAAHSTKSPAFLVRRAWLSVTGDAVPARLIVAQGTEAAKAGEMVEARK